MYCTAGRVASRNSRAVVVSATSSPLTRTCTRALVGSMVIGCPALGSLISGWLMVNTSSDANKSCNTGRRSTLPRPGRHEPGPRGPSLFGLGGLGVLAGLAHRGPEAGGLPDRFLDRARLPAQFADRLAVVDIGFGAHHPHRLEAEFGVFSGEAGLQAAQRAQRIERGHRDRS